MLIAWSHESNIIEVPDPPVPIDWSKPQCMVIFGASPTGAALLCSLHQGHEGDHWPGPELPDD